MLINNKNRCVKDEEREVGKEKIGGKGEKKEEENSK